jgi:hypothetical protein
MVLEVPVESRCHCRQRKCVIIHRILKKFVVLPVVVDLAADCS